MMPQKKNTRPTREQRRAQRREDFTAIRRQAKDHPGMTAVYFVLRLLVLAVMVLQAIKGDYYNVLLCALTLVLFLIPTFVAAPPAHRRAKTPWKSSSCCSFFAAEIFRRDPGVLPDLPLLGHHAPHHERLPHGGHREWPWWTSSTAAGSSGSGLSPAFVALLAFCFSMTTGGVWEFFEYGMDTFFHTDMQKGHLDHRLLHRKLKPLRSQRPGGGWRWTASR